MMVFVDTGAWFAWFVPDDPNHAAVARSIDSAPNAVVTTDYCVDETLTLLVARRRSRLALRAGRFFFQQDLVVIHFLTPDQIHRAWLLFQRRAATGLSFTDCTSKVVMDDLNISTAVALDDHFRRFGVTVVP